MRYVKKPENFEEPVKNNLVIGYYHGKSIVKDELHRLYFIECEEECAPIGTMVGESIMEPIEKLNGEEYEQIMEIYGCDEG